MNREEVYEIIIGHICKVLPKLKGYKFQPSDTLKELGANSIDRSEIVIEVLSSLSLKIPFREVAGAKKIGELASLLHEKFN